MGLDGDFAGGVAEGTGLLSGAEIAFGALAGVGFNGFVGGINAKPDLRLGGSTVAYHHCTARTHHCFLT